MFVAVLKLHFAIYEIHSLKEKRSIVKSMMRRIHNKFKVSMAEIDAQDDLQRLILGFSLVGNDRRLLDSQMSHLENFAENLGLAQLCEAPRVIESYSSLGQKVP